MVDYKLTLSESVQPKAVIGQEKARNLAVHECGTETQIIKGEDDMSIYCPKCECHTWRGAPESLLNLLAAGIKQK